MVDVSGDIQNAANVSVTAQASDISNADLSQNGGGGISVSISNAKATSTPNVTTDVSGDVNVELVFEGSTQAVASVLLVIDDEHGDFAVICVGK